MCASSIVWAVAAFLSFTACGDSSTTSDDDGGGETSSSTTASSTTSGDGTADASTTAATVGDGTADASTAASTTVGDRTTEDGTTTAEGSSEDGATTGDGESDESASSGSGGEDTYIDEATCDALESIFDQALSEARRCLAGGTVETQECDEGLTVEDLCGCPHAVSDQHPVAAGDALSARVAFQAQCPTPERCALIDCAPASASGHCELTEHPDGVCQFD